MAQKRNSFFIPGKNQTSKTKHSENNENKEEYKKNLNKQNRQNNFDENRNGLQEGSQEKQDVGKKPFDKKAYRLKKYSKKYKLQQFEEQRKKKLLHSYQKVLKEEMPGSYKSKAFDEDTTDSHSAQVGRFVRHPDLIEKDGKKPEAKSKKDPFRKAKEHFEKIKQEKMEKREKAEKAREERAKKIAEYKKKKQERFKKLSVKNKRGQPVMGLRMELLLDKIKLGSN